MTAQSTTGTDVGINGGMRLAELWQVVEDVLVMMREPMTLKDARHARSTLTAVYVMQQKRNAAAKAGKTP